MRKEKTVFLMRGLAIVLAVMMIGCSGAGTGGNTGEAGGAENAENTDTSETAAISEDADDASTDEESAAGGAADGAGSESAAGGVAGGAASGIRKGLFKNARSQNNEDTDTETEAGSDKEAGAVTGSEEHEGTETTEESSADAASRETAADVSTGASGQAAASETAADASTGAGGQAAPSEIAADASTGASGQAASSETAADASTGSTGHASSSETAAESRGLIVIDPGHQQHASLEQEPIGPGASETKAEVSGGTTGVSSGVPEYQLTLDVALLLRDELEKRGYTVVMVRETNDVDISNSERASIANDMDADAFVRLHANGVDNGSVTGAMTICQTPGNAYNGDLYEESRALSDCILDAYTQKTGIDYEQVWETDTMSGINWCRVPVTILEMGYMTNSEEDRWMTDAENQKLMAEGVADGIDAFIEKYPPEGR